MSAHLSNLRLGVSTHEDEINGINKHEAKRRRDAREAFHPEVDKDDNITSSLSHSAALFSSSLFEIGQNLQVLGSKMNWVTMELHDYTPGLRIERWTVPERRCHTVD